MNSFEMVHAIFGAQTVKFGFQIADIFEAFYKRCETAREEKLERTAIMAALAGSSQKDFSNINVSQWDSNLRPQECKPCTLS